MLTLRASRSISIATRCYIRSFSSFPMSGSAPFFQAVEDRRSYYNLSDKSPLSNEELLALVQKAVKHAPTSFNMQQSRAVLVVGARHKALWEAVKIEYIKTLGEDKEKIEAANVKFATEYAGAYGTVAFFEDQDVIKGWSAKMPFLTDAFNVWSENSAGILQYIVWTALKAEGLGANLQHHAALTTDIQDAIVKVLEVSPAWKSTALLPFGVPTGAPGRGPKVFSPVEDRVKAIFE